MSERVDPAGERSGEPYSPFERIELARGNGLLTDLFFLLFVLGGLSLQGGQFGVAAWLVLLACWAIVRIEFTFAIGAVMFVGLTGARSGFADTLAVAVGPGVDIPLVAIVVTLIGLGGLLAIDLGRTWRSMYPVAVFAVLLGLSAAVLAFTNQGTALQLLGAGTAATLVSASYVLHRYERGLQWRVRSAEETVETDISRSENQ